MNVLSFFVPFYAQLYAWQKTVPRLVPARGFFERKIMTMDNDDYYNIRVSQIPVGREIENREGVLAISGAYFCPPSQEQLKRSMEEQEGSERPEPCLSLSIEDNTASGDGIQLAIELDEAINEPSCCWVVLSLPAARNLHAALSAIIAMREAAEK